MKTVCNSQSGYYPTRVLVSMSVQVYVQVVTPYYGVLMALVIETDGFLNSYTLFFIMVKKLELIFDSTGISLDS